MNLFSWICNLHIYYVFSWLIKPLPIMMSSGCLCMWVCWGKWGGQLSTIWTSNRKHIAVRKWMKMVRCPPNYYGDPQLVLSQNNGEFHPMTQNWKAPLKSLDIYLLSCLYWLLLQDHVVPAPSPKSGKLSKPELSHLNLLWFVFMVYKVEVPLVHMCKRESESKRLG